MTTEESSSALSKMLSSRREAHWHFVTPGGNFGDDLIYAGAEALATRLGIRWTTHSHNTFSASELSPGSAVYLHGSGGFNSWCKGTAFDNLRIACSISGAFVVQGPHSCDPGDPSISDRYRDCLRRSAAAEVHLIARERTTFNFLMQRVISGAQLHLDHDSALQLTRNEFLALAGLAEPLRQRYRLFVRREDNEALRADRRFIPGAVTLDPPYYASTFAHWLRIHALATEIVTDRLHSAIAGSILGTPVGLLAGRYHKNRSLWTYSLADRGVKWIPDANSVTEPERDPPGITRRFRDSWKLRRLRNAIRGVPLR